LIETTGVQFPRVTVHPVEIKERTNVVVRQRWVMDIGVGVSVALAQVGIAFAQVAHRGGAVTSVSVLLLIAGGLVLIPRRHYPTVIMVLAYAITLTFQATQHFGGTYEGSAWLSVIVAFGTAIYFRRRIAAIIFLVVCYVVSLWGPAVTSDQAAPSATFALSLGAGLAALLAASELIRMQRQRSSALSQGKREELLRRAGEERLQIARDLHDVVAHNISVINVHANTALHLMDRQPERARLALTTINDVSKQALVELRSMLGILRDVDEQPPRSPTPSLAQLDELLDRVRASGLTVNVREEGVAVPLPTDVDLAAYRIAQEALTNSVRHSGATTVEIHIAYAKHEVVLDVGDNGVGQSPSSAGGIGNGIIGMTERAQALGGTLQTGNRIEGGFGVRVTLPIAKDEP
jgi:signal transduction histidine kinase